MGDLEAVECSMDLLAWKRLLLGIFSVVSLHDLQGFVFGSTVLRYIYGIHIAYFMMMLY